MERLKNFGFSMSILGGLFKLMSWQGANVIFIIGGLALALYFFIKVFEKSQA
jgi:hypothetical protein